MKLTVDFSDVQSKSVIPAGDYPGVIADVLLKEKAGSDHPYFSWDVVIAEGEYEGRHPQPMTTSFKPEALWKMMETFQNLGFDAKEIDLDVDDETGQLKDPEVIGRPCVVQIFNEPYNGRQTSKISSILGPNGEGGTPEAPATPPPAAAKSTPGSKPSAPANGTKKSPFPATAGKRVFK